jgi:hypothetical protein
MEEKEGGRFELQDLSSRACDPRPLHEGEREERPTNWEERTATPEISPTHHKEQTKGFVIGQFSRNAAKETWSHVHDMSQLGEVMRRDATECGFSPSWIR